MWADWGWGWGENKSCRSNALKMRINNQSQQRTVFCSCTKRHAWLRAWWEHAIMVWWGDSIWKYSIAVGREKTDDGERPGETIAWLIWLELGRGLNTTDLLTGWPVGKMVGRMKSWSTDITRRQQYRQVIRLCQTTLEKRRIQCLRTGKICVVWQDMHIFNAFIRI